MRPIGVVWCALFLIAAASSGEDRSAAASPSPRYVHQMMTYDDERGYVLMFGGAGQDRSYGDLWALGDSGWNKLSETGPPERDAGVFVYDSTRKRSVLYGGRNSTGELHDTWEWDGTRWHAVATSGPTASVHAAAAFDRVRGTVVVFFPMLAPGPQPRPLPSETWLWNGQRWAKASAATPNDVMPMGMTTDRTSGVVYLLASRLGSDSSGMPPGPTELWMWTGRDWQRDPSSPPQVTEALQANIAPAGKTGLLLYHAGEPARNRGTWRWDGGSWTHLGSEGPSPRSVHVMSFDERRNRVVLFGGSVRRERLGDTWIWDGKRWLEQ